MNQATELALRVTCVIHSLDGGGAERVMAGLCSSLARRGHHVTLITLDDGQRERHEVDLAVQRVRLDLMSTSHGWLQKLVRNRQRITRLRSAVTSTLPDIVLSFCDRTNILTLLACGGLEFPVVVSERSDPAQQRLGWIWERLRDRTYRRAAQIVALTDTSADFLGARYTVPVTVIPSAVDAPPQVSDRVMASAAKRIVSIGRLEEEKGFDRLIVAFSELPRDCDDWSLTLLGEGSLRKALEDRVRTLGLQQRIAMPGWVSPVWSELSSATIFVLPSRYEGFPSALLEAMSMGVPVIATDCESGPRVILRDPSWGLLVPNSTEAIGAGMRRLITQPEFRERLGAAGRSASKEFGWEIMVDRYESLLAQTARSRYDERETGP